MHATIIRTHMYATINITHMLVWASPAPLPSFRATFPEKVPHDTIRKYLTGLRSMTPRSRGHSIVITRSPLSSGVRWEGALGQGGPL